MNSLETEQPPPVKRAPTRMERANSIYEEGWGEWLHVHAQISRSLFEWQCSKLDSDLERMFLAACWFALGDVCDGGHVGPVMAFGSTLKIEPQKQVGPYIVDFAFTLGPGAYYGGQPAIQVAVECDGAYFHDREAKQVERDRARDRFLNLHGWRVMRFSEREIVRDPRGCVSQVTELIRRIAREQIAQDAGMVVE